MPGGGVALIRASKVLDGLKLGGDQQIGVNIVKRAIEEPMRWIATNAGHEGSIVVQKVREMKDDRGLQRADRHLRGSRQGRRHRPGEGRALGAPELVVDRQSLLLTTEAPHLRNPRREEGSGRRTPAAPAAWAGCTKVKSLK